GPGHVGIVAHTANGDGTDFSLGFDYLPTVASVSPPAGPTSGGNPVHVTGSGFAGASSVSFGGTAATFTVTDDGDITATAPSHSAGTVDVQVTTNGETSPTSSGDQYTYVAPPTVTGVHPDAGPAGGGTNVRVDGTDFVSGSTVKFGGAATGPVTFVSPAELKLHAPAHAAGVVDVRVTTPGGTSATSNADKYAYGPPAVSGVGPAAEIGAEAACAGPRGGRGRRAGDDARRDVCDLERRQVRVRAAGRERRRPGGRDRS